MNTIKFVEEVRLKEAFWDKYKYRVNRCNENILTQGE